MSIPGGGQENPNIPGGGGQTGGGRFVPGGDRGGYETMDKNVYINQIYKYFDSYEWTLDLNVAFCLLYTQFNHYYDCMCF